MSTHTAITRQNSNFQMGVGIKIGTIVTGVCGKVLSKGEFAKADRDKRIRGIVTKMVGTGRGRKWTVQWDESQKSSTVSSRSLTVYQPETSSDEESSSPSDSQESEDDDLRADAAGQEQSALGAHGLHWERVDAVTVDTLSFKRRFSLRWRVDLPVKNRSPADFFYLLFPMKAFEGFLQLTNVELQKQRQRLATNSSRSSDYSSPCVWWIMGTNDRTGLSVMTDYFRGQTLASMALESTASR